MLFKQRKLQSGSVQRDDTRPLEQQNALAVAILLGLFVLAVITLVIASLIHDGVL